MLGDERFFPYLLTSHGWIKISQIMHSQLLREAPLKPWVIPHASGKLKSAHCTCMARGLPKAPKRHLCCQINPL
ncbi:hypothetical protein ILYODFUR_017980 [Ilyodon furcidens]|uniref:Uncharacterized protein n=1 Tax=Ilyodon furcidens TaxID=33524 RepID=A0ABV0TKP7_9TELE